MIPLQDGTILLLVPTIVSPYFSDDGTIVRDVLIDKDATFLLAGTHDLEYVLDDSKESVLTTTHVFH